MGSQTPVVDAHFHIWELDRFSYQWPTPDTPSLYKNFTIEQYDASRQTTPVQYAVFVQVLTSSMGETDWVLSLAEQHTSIKGIVAYFDLTSPTLRSDVEKYKKTRKVVGVRHILDFEKEDWLRRDDVLHGLKTLEDLEMTFDLLLRPHLLQYALEVVRKFPRLKFVIDHIAKPPIKDQLFDGWAQGMAELAKFPNVYCKISGLVTEADHDTWKRTDFEPYVKHVFEHFGPDRCMFGSDWPLGPGMDIATYRQVYELAQDLFKDVSQEDKDKIFGLNAIHFYGLDMSTA